MTQIEQRKQKGLLTAQEVQHLSKVNGLTFFYHKANGMIPKATVRLGGRRAYYTQAEATMIREYFERRVWHSPLRK